MNLIALISLLLSTAIATAGPPRLGTARGTSSIKDEPAVTLTRAAAFADAAAKSPTTLLVISDLKLPVEKWANASDISRSGKPFSGAVIHLGKDNAVLRTDFYWKGSPYIATALFTVTLDQKAGEGLSGNIKTHKTPTPRSSRTKISGTFSYFPESPKVDATFHAELK